jgi:DNA polymerase IV
MVAQQRYIAHFDLDSFFVSVELLKDPSLRGKPVVVGGHSDRGVVSAASYEARKFGIHSAMPMHTARKLCPQLVVANSGYADYGKFSRWVTDIIAAKAPLFEKASVDEFYIDLTGMDKFFDVLQWTVELRQAIIDATKLPISFGLSTNKMIAKIATDEAKPNGYLFIPPGNEKAFLAPLKVSKIPGVGEQTFRTLLQMGIETIGELSAYDSKQLENQLGKYGEELWQKAQGWHFGEVSPYHESKSISSENTFHTNTNDLVFLQSEIVRLTEKVAHEMREDGKMCTCIAVKIRYADFETTTKQMMIEPTEFDHKLVSYAKDLFQKSHRKGQALRLLGVRLSHFVAPNYQANLFEDAGQMKNLYHAIDAVKDRFGRSSVQRAGGKLKDEGDLK